jgi:predicted unusual protein kinase regulating ubiquinone biosynthesis (AarF/ABC1/UbiB family)
VVASWIREKLGPAGIAHDVSRSVSALGRLAQKLPDLIEQSGALVQNLELAYQKSRSWDDIREARWRTQALRSQSIVLALWTIAAILAYIVFTR